MKGTHLGRRQNTNELRDIPSDLENESTNTSLSDLLQPKEWPLCPMNWMVQHKNNNANSPQKFEREVENCWITKPATARENPHRPNLVSPHPSYTDKWTRRGDYI